MSIITDADLATYLNLPTIAGTTHAIQSAAIGSGIVFDYMHNAGMTSTIQTVTNQIIDGPAQGSNVFILPGFPLVSLSAVSVWDQASLSWSLLTQGMDYNWSNNGLVSRVQIADATIGWIYWPAMQGSIQVSYTYGRTVIPDSVKGIALSVAARVFTNPEGLGSQTISGYSQSYLKSKTGSLLGLDDAEKLILGVYSDWTVA